MEEIILLCGTVAEFEPFNVAEGMIDPFWCCIQWNTQPRAPLF